MLGRRRSASWRWALPASISAALLATGAGTSPQAQPTVQRTVLQRADLAGTAGQEGVIVQVELPPGSATGRHTHPGSELGYLLEGSIELELEGMPARTIAPGESWIIEPGRVHDAKDAGQGTARAVVVYVVEKGKPLALPAP